MTLDAYVVGAFSKDGAGGNKAGVVLLNSPLSGEQKTQIARRLGYSETAFLSESEQADWKLEYFTPMGEVPLCGHATVGTFIVLDHLKLAGRPACQIETKSGVLQISVDPDHTVFMQQKAPEFYEILGKADVQDCFRQTAIAESLPIQIVSTGLRDILLPIESPAALESMSPDFHRIARLSAARNCVGVHAFSLVKGGDVTAICRNFAPLYGIDEESATGTSSCALACYLFQYGLRRSLYTFEQGHHLKSVSKLYVRVEQEDNQITGVSVGGNGFLIDRIRVPVP